MKIWIALAVLAWFSVVANADYSSEFQLIASPVQDAREAYQQGVKEFVSIELSQQTLIPGLKQKQQQYVKQRYRLRPLNRRWKTFANVEDDKMRLRELIHYANRFNITLWQLIEAEQNKPKRQYRY